MGFGKLVKPSDERARKLRRNRQKPDSAAGRPPQAEGIDVFGGTLPLNGVVGGDHLSTWISSSGSTSTRASSEPRKASSTSSRT